MCLIVIFFYLYLSFKVLWCFLNIIPQLSPPSLDLGRSLALPLSVPYIIEKGKHSGFSRKALGSFSRAPLEKNKKKKRFLGRTFGRELEAFLCLVAQIPSNPKWPVGFLSAEAVSLLPCCCFAQRGSVKL